jgi:hypothetical protein
MLNFIYESRVEYANIERYVVFVYWSKNIFFDEIVYLFLSERCKLRKNDVYDWIEFKSDSESEYRSRNEDESENEIKIISRIEHETQICSRCEMFSKAIAITFKWVRKSFKFWFLIDRDNELIIRLRHNWWFRNRCCETMNWSTMNSRNHDCRHNKIWSLSIEILSNRLKVRWSLIHRVRLKV